MPSTTVCPCPLCGRPQPAGTGPHVPCADCARYFPGPRPKRRPAAPAGRGFRPTVPVCLAIAFAGAGLILAEYWYLQTRREDRSAALADGAVARKVAAGEAAIARGDWDEALQQLEGAEEARPLLLRARRGQAAALLDGARAAVAAKDPVRARRLLREYLAHPHAAEPDEAGALEDGLARALSDEEAKHTLRRLSDAELGAFGREGRLPGPAEVRAPGLAELRVATLRRHLADEQARRDALRAAAKAEVERKTQERARREARLKAGDAYAGVKSFAAAVAKKHAAQREQAARQEQALAQLFRQLRVTDPGEQAALRASLRAGGAAEDLPAAVTKKRAEVKKSFRLAEDFDPADGATFDALVDSALDALLRELRKP